VSLLVSLLQTLTSVQEQTLTAVPRLVVVFVVTMAALPWMVHRLTNFTLHMLTGLHKYLG
jgi:flagellar biosynthetic protein FliQ